MGEDREAVGLGVPGVVLLALAIDRVAERQLRRQAARRRGRGELGLQLRAGTSARCGAGWRGGVLRERQGLEQHVEQRRRRRICAGERIVELIARSRRGAIDVGRAERAKVRAGGKRVDISRGLRAKADAVGRVHQLAAVEAADEPIEAAGGAVEAHFLREGLEVDGEAGAISAVKIAEIDVLIAARTPIAIARDRGHVDAAAQGPIELARPAPFINLFVRQVAGGCTGSIRGGIAYRVEREGRRRKL